MRRYITAILFVLVLVTPFILRMFVGEKTTAAASSDSPNQLIILTSHTESIRREYADAFRAWYKAKYNQDVYVDYLALGSGDITNLLKDRHDVMYPQMHTYKADLAWGGGDHLFDVDLKPYLQGVQIDPDIMAKAFPQPTMNGLPLYDAHYDHKTDFPHWYGAALSSFGITFNRSVLGYLKLPDPQTWNDLADPKYAGWLILADPGPSISARSAFLAIVEKAMVDAGKKDESEDSGWAHGMGQIRLIGANARSFASGSSFVPGVIASGDAAAGMTIDYYGRTEVDYMPQGMLGYVQPVGATVINPDPIGMIQGAEHRELALRFMEFLLSQQGQLLWNTKVGATGGPKSTNLRRLPIMPSVYADMSNFTDKDDPFKTAGEFNKSDARESTFGIIGELIEASCINCLPELTRARQAILACAPARAKELDSRLGMFPFDQKEALRRAAEFKKATPVEQLAIRRAWTEEFKTEYELLRVEASVP